MARETLNWYPDIFAYCCECGIMQMVSVRRLCRECYLYDPDEDDE